MNQERTFINFLENERRTDILPYDSCHVVSILEELLDLLDLFKEREDDF
jgi:hypothetical protein